MDDATLMQFITCLGELAGLLKRIHNHPLGASFLFVHVDLCTDAMAAINDRLERRNL